MAGTIYLVQSDDQLIEMTEKYYDSEALLQELLDRYPNLLAGDQIDEDNPRRWLLVSREMGVPWEEGGSDQMSLDHLFLDQDGIPTLVEVKRSSDTRIRREVVGQMLDYAAHAVAYWPAEQLRAKFEAKCEASGRDPNEQIAGLLQSDPEDESVVDAFWQQVGTNLQAGRLRLLFVADEIPPQLRRIVEFLNQQMDHTEVLAVEIKQFVGKGVKTLVPRVLGQTAEAQQRKSGSGREIKQWDEASFFEELETRRGQTDAQVARQILAWANKHMPTIYWGRGKRSGSFTPGLEYGGQWHQLIGVWSNGYVEVQFQYMKSRGSLDDAMRWALLERLQGIPGLTLPANSTERRPSFPLKALATADALERFFADLEWALEQIKTRAGKA